MDKFIITTMGYDENNKYNIHTTVAYELLKSAMKENQKKIEMIFWDAAIETMDDDLLRTIRNRCTREMARRHIPRE